MKFRLSNILAYSLVFTLLCTSCKSEFEKVRLSNDPETIRLGSIKYFEDGDYLKAQTLLELILNQFRGTKEAEDLFFNFAYTHYHLRQYQLASHYFKNFANTFAYSQKREESDFMAAYSNYRLSPGFRLDQKPTEEAIVGFQEFANNYPNSERVQEANDLIDGLRAKLEAKSFDQGELYADIGEYQAAIQSYENTLQEFPDTDRAEFIRYKIFKSAYLYASKSIFEKRAERYEECIKKLGEFETKHPESQYLDEAQNLATAAQKEIKSIRNGGYQN